MSDKLLWNQLKAGKRQALESIYRNNFAHLYNYGKKLSRDESLIEDCIQDLFVELWEKRDRLGDTDSIKPYLLVSIRRKIINTANKLQKTISDKEPTDESFEAELSIDSLLVEDEKKRENQHKLREAMLKLSHRQREVIYLKYQQNMDYKDIADSMNINYQSVRNLVSKAISQLSKHIGFIGVLILFDLFEYKTLISLLYY